jgi:hypothetical protein
MGGCLEWRGRVSKWIPIALSTFSFIDTLLRMDGKKRSPTRRLLFHHRPVHPHLLHLELHHPIRGPIGPPLKKRPVPRPATNPTGEVGERRVDVGKGQGSGQGENWEMTLGEKEKPKEKPKGKDGGLVLPKRTFINYFQLQHQIGCDINLQWYIQFAVLVLSFSKSTYVVGVENTIMYGCTNYKYIQRIWRNPSKN